MLLALSLLAACTGEPWAPPPEDDERPGCGPLRPETVTGRTPSYVDTTADRFASDHAACAGVWLRSTRWGFVPQGVAVRGRTAWVSGYDGDRRIGRLWCMVLRVDLRTGRTLDSTTLVDVPVDGATMSCRHGGGLAADDHGVWLTEAARLWLLDPRSLEVRRVWSLRSGVRGSFAVFDDQGRLGIGAHRAHRRGWLDWLDPDALVAGDDSRIDDDQVLEHVVAPPNTQGVIWGRLGERAPALWFVRSSTRCGIVVGPAGRLGFVPGAEGTTVDARGRLWVVSESGSRVHQEKGGRPVIPSLVRYDDARARSWSRPTCHVGDRK